MTYTVIYEKGPSSWGAYVPDLPGVISVGDSRDEVERLILEAIEFHVEGMREGNRFGRLTLARDRKSAMRVCG